MKNEIIIFEKDDIKLEVNMKDETVWLTQAQMAELFGRDVKTISKHIINAYKEELNKKSNSQKMRIANSDKLVSFYNLDTIISVGYRVKSKRGTEFRIWANTILKNYLLKGYVINEKRLEQLEKTVKLIDIANRTNLYENNEASNILKVIGIYSKGLDLLDDYDHRNLKKLKGNISDLKITYDECIKLISNLKFNETSKIFALEKEIGLESIINNIYQSYDDKDVYKSVEEKAANFLYLIVKDHVFIDGNKRIGATLFLYFLNFYGLLYNEEKEVINSNTLVALTILMAESNPKEKDIMVDLIMNIIG